MRFLILFPILIVGSSCEPTKQRAKNLLDMSVFMFWDRIPPPVANMIREMINIEKTIDADLDHKCSHSSEDYNAAVNSIVECTKNTDRSISVCTTLKTRPMSCYTPFINLTENCMTEKLKGLPTFIAKSTKSMLNHICGLTGEQMFELFNDCTYLSEYIEDDRKSIIKEMHSKMKKIKYDLSVKNICSTGPEMKNLIKQLLEKSCSNKMTQDLFLGIGDAILKPCTTINEP